MDLTDEQRLLVQQEIQKELQKGRNRDTLSNEMFQIGGGIAGAGLGLAMIEPVDFIKEKIDRRNQIKRSNLISNERDAYVALREIHTGKATFAQYGEAADVLRDLYKDENIKELLDDERAFKQHIDKLSRGHVVHMGKADVDPRFAKQQQLVNKQMGARELKRLVPGNHMFRNIGGKLMHPLVSIGGLGGVAAGKSIYNHLQDKKDFENE